MPWLPSSTLGQTDRLLSFLTPCYPPYMVAEQGSLKSLKALWGRAGLKIGQRGGLVTSSAFGNKRKWILFAHTEENSASPHKPFLPGSQRTCVHFRPNWLRGSAHLCPELQSGTPEDTEGASEPHMNGVISLDDRPPPQHQTERGTERLPLLKATPCVRVEADPRARPHSPLVAD